MTGAPFSWKALQRELQASAYLDPADDLSTQRGLVATAMAILDRMSGDLGHVSWQPLRISEKKARMQDALAGETPDGRYAVAKPEPQPSSPRPGGAAVAVPCCG